MTWDKIELNADDQAQYEAMQKWAQEKEQRRRWRASQRRDNTALYIICFVLAVVAGYCLAVGCSPDPEPGSTVGWMGPRLFARVMWGE
jgi:hypothetical protein